MSKLAIAFFAFVVFGCSANHQTTIQDPSGRDIVSVDGNADGNTRTSKSDYRLCLEQEGYFDILSNPYAEETCQKLFAGGK